jgi:hypothetical protein
MEFTAILKIVFFVLWPLLIMGIIRLVRKYRKDKGSGNSLWHH